MPVTLSAPAKTEPHIKDETFRPDSPFKRRILGVIENLLPSSPDLLSVPETPESQIRLSTSLSIFRDVSLICQSPVSREPSTHHILTKDERKTKRDISGPRKRLISPPQESHDAKRSMNSNPLTTHSLNVHRPVKATQSDAHNKGSEMFSHNSRIRETSLRNGTVKNESGSKFTMITEQKPTDAQACETLSTHQRVSVQAAAAHVQKYSLPTTPAAVLTTAEEGGMESSEEEAVRVALNSFQGDQDDGTLNPGSAEGIVIQLCVSVGMGVSVGVGQGYLFYVWSVM